MNRLCSKSTTIKKLCIKRGWKWGEGGDHPSKIGGFFKRLFFIWDSVKILVKFDLKNKVLEIRRPIYAYTMISFSTQLQQE